LIVKVADQNVSGNGMLNFAAEAGIVDLLQFSYPHDIQSHDCNVLIFGYDVSIKFIQ
jgi:hypothetical protein